MKHRMHLFLAAALVVLLSNQSYGSIIAQYYVQSTSVVNGSDKDGNDAPHGLWTDKDDYGSTDDGTEYYDIDTGMLFTRFSDGTATLKGTATNPYGTVATIDLTFDDFLSSVSDPANEYKKEQGLAYDEDEHDFYDSVSGTIKFDWSGGSDTVTIDHFVGDYKFQFGLGANAKSPTEFGGSAWIQDADGSGDMISHHWDLNLHFYRGSSSGAIPEPATVVIWSVLGVSGIAFGRRRKKQTN